MSSLFQFCKSSSNSRKRQGIPLSAWNARLLPNRACIYGEVLFATVGVGRETNNGLIHLKLSHVSHGTNDNSVFHGRAARKRRGDLQKRDLPSCVSASQQRRSLGGPLVGGRGGGYVVPLHTAPRFYSFFPLSSCYSPLDGTDARPKRIMRGSFPLPLPFSAIMHAHRAWSMDLYRRSRSRKSDGTPVWINESSEGRGRHFICWSRSLSAFFIQHSEKHCGEFFYAFQKYI